MEYKAGTIRKATWKNSHLNQPYILLEIETEPIHFHGKIITKLFKSVNPIVPTPPGCRSPLQQLEDIAGKPLKVSRTGMLYLDEDLPELRNRPILLELEEVAPYGRLRPHIKRYFPVYQSIKGGKQTMETQRLRDLRPGDMWKRPGGTFRYVVSPQRAKKYSDDLSIYCYNLDGDSDGYWMPGYTHVVLLSPEGEPEPKPTLSSFYMCHVERGGSPTVRHTGSEAYREAERLVKTTHRRVFVLKAVAYVDYTIPTTPEYQWTKITP